MIEVTLLTGTAFDRSTLASKGESLLNATELDRFARLRSRSAQETFAVSRWLIHQCLSRLNLSEQDSWRLSVDDLGRPIAVEQSTNSTIRYSLSHRQDAIACALSAEAAVGIDLEPWDQPISSSMIEIAFTENERERLSSQIDPSRREWIARWTIKEAIAKMKGTVGLEALRQICTANIVRWPQASPSYFSEGPCWLYSPTSISNLCVTLAVDGPIDGTPEVSWREADSWLD